MLRSKCTCLELNQCPVITVKPRGSPQCDVFGFDHTVIWFLEFLVGYHTTVASACIYYKMMVCGFFKSKILSIETENLEHF